MNRKKKIVIRATLLAIIFSLIFFLLKKGYKYYDSFLLFGKNYFGIFFIPVTVVILLDIFFTFINSRKKRIFYKTRLFFFIIFSMSVSLTFVLGTLAYFKKLEEANIIDMCLMDYKMGFLMTHFIIFIYNSFKLNYIFYVSSVLIFISLFFLTGKEISRVIKHFITCKRRKEALKLEKALLAQMQEQIAIKENLEERKAEEYEKQNIILETVIKEKVEMAIENDTLPLEKVDEKVEENDFPKEDTIK